MVGMINTDKYEGHTPAPWDWFPKTNDSHIGHLERHSNLTRITAEIKSRSAENDANAQLIADAPLLLAEVKRLRELLESVVDNAAEPSGDDGTGYRYCEVDAELVEMIEEEMKKRGEEE